MLRFSLSVF